MNWFLIAYLCTIVIGQVLTVKEDIQQGKPIPESIGVAVGIALTWWLIYMSDIFTLLNTGE